MTTRLNKENGRRMRSVPTLVGKDEGRPLTPPKTCRARPSNKRPRLCAQSATYTNVPEACGFLYFSGFTGHTCVAVFDRAVDLR